MKRRDFTAQGVGKMLCNPAYIGIRIHPDLIRDRPTEYDRDRFIEIAKKKTDEVGIEQCVRDLLQALKEPRKDDWVYLIPIHRTFALERDGIIGEELFIQAAKRLINEIGVTNYFENVMENLSQSIVDVGLVTP